MSFLGNELQTTGQLLLLPMITISCREVGDELGQVADPEEDSQQPVDNECRFLIPF